MKRITVTKNGPYRVEGGVPLAEQVIEPNEEGESWDWRRGREFEAPDTYLLCRCGGSANKPFCDGTHKLNGFEGTETADGAPYLEQAAVFPGPEVNLTDAESFCSSARFCDARGSIWRLVRRAGEPARELTEREAGHCPSGRLVTWPGQPGAGEPVGEPAFEPSIGVVEDPQEGVSGPLWVRGRIPIESEEGGAPYEVRNRMTLCRCGASQNKPFCDGSHVTIGFRNHI